jgi:hypothetical protein
MSGNRLRAGSKKRVFLELQQNDITVSPDSVGCMGV